MNDYVPLNVRSTYSIGDSICQIPRLVRKAREMAFPAMALVDTNLCGAVEFQLIESFPTPYISLIPS